MRHQYRTFLEKFLKAVDSEVITATGENVLQLRDLYHDAKELLEPELYVEPTESDLE